MELVIHDLLAYACTATRAETFGLVDCGAVLGVVLSNLGTEIEKSDAAITFDELTAVTGDKTQLIQLFQHLVGNALKYRSERPPHIHVSAKRIQEFLGLAFNDIRMESAIQEVHSTAGKGWLFSVTDNGIGIDPLYLDRVFQTHQGLPADRKKIHRHGPRHVQKNRGAARRPHLGRFRAGPGFHVLFYDPVHPLKRRDGFPETAGSGITGNHSRRNSTAEYA